MNCSLYWRIYSCRSMRWLNNRLLMIKFLPWCWTRILAVTQARQTIIPCSRMHRSKITGVNQYPPPRCHFSMFICLPQSAPQEMSNSRPGRPRVRTFTMTEMATDGQIIWKDLQIMVPIMPVRRYGSMGV